MLDDNSLLMWGAGYVCDDGFDQESARVACQSMGFDDVGTFETSQDIPSGAVFSLDDFTCDMYDMYMTDCQYTENHNCGGSEAIMLVCLDIPEGNFSLQCKPRRTDTTKISDIVRFISQRQTYSFVFCKNRSFFKNGIVEVGFEYSGVSKTTAAGGQVSSPPKKDYSK